MRISCARGYHDNRSKESPAHPSNYCDRISHLHRVCACDSLRCASAGSRGVVRRRDQEDICNPNADPKSAEKEEQFDDAHETAEPDTNIQTTKISAISRVSNTLAIRPIEEKARGREGGGNGIACPGRKEQKELADSGAVATS